MNLHRKEFQLKFKTGTDADKSKFKKECVQGELYFTTDTNSLYVAETTAGANDATLCVFYKSFNTDLTFPTIEVFNNETDFINANNAPNYTIVYAKDTNKIYVWESVQWYVFNQDSSA
jgi:hypothetical protein